MAAKPRPETPVDICLAAARAELSRQLLEGEKLDLRRLVEVILKAIP